MGDWLVPIASGLFTSGVVMAWTEWRCHVLYGPVISGNARWRRERGPS